MASDIRPKPPGPHATLRTGEPTLIENVFSQAMEVSADHAIPPYVMERVMVSAERAFRGSLAMNGWTAGDYKWPPAYQIMHKPDLTGATIIFETPVSRAPHLVTSH